MPATPESIPKSGKTSSAPLVALTGFMAAGKSTVGRCVGELLHWRFIDLDCEIECRSRRTIREIFDTDGELRFREIECAALSSVLEQISTPTVIALGGGTFVQPRNASLLRDCGALVVFLELPVEELLQRCQTAAVRCSENSRPLSADAAAFRALYAQRLPLYRQADLIWQCDAKTADQTAREIAAKLGLAAAADRNR